MHHTMKVHGELEVYFHTFLTSHWKEVSVRRKARVRFWCQSCRYETAWASEPVRMTMRGYAYSAGRFRFRKSAPIGMRKSFRQTVWLRLPATTIRTSTDKQRTFFVPTLGICIWNWICLHCTRTQRKHFLYTSSLFFAVATLQDPSSPPTKRKIRLIIEGPRKTSLSIFSVFFPPRAETLCWDLILFFL